MNHYFLNDSSNRLIELLESRLYLLGTVLLYKNKQEILL